MFVYNPSNIPLSCSTPSSSAVNCCYPQMNPSSSLIQNSIAPYSTPNQVNSLFLVLFNFVRS